MPGLSWRLSVGFDRGAELPYLIAPGTDTSKGYSLYPEPSRFFGFVGLRYHYGGL